MYKRLKPFNSGFLFEFANTMQADHEKETNPSQREEAVLQGLELMHRTNDPNYNLYKYNNCNHLDFLQPTHVRRGNFKCSTCFQNRLVIEACNKGFTYLFRDKTVYKKYIKPCGHIASLTPQAVATSKVANCKECYQELLQESAEKFGYIVLIAQSSGRSLIKFKGCQHEKSTLNQQILRGNVVCETCKIESLIEDVQSKGLVYKSPTEECRYSLFTLPCGHDKVLRNDHAREGSALCDECGDSHYLKPSSVYLFQFEYNGFSWLKLGFSRNLKLRKVGYGLPLGTETELLYTLDLDKGIDAVRIEKNLHLEFKKFRYTKKTMQDYHTISGFTECYDISAKSELISALCKIKEERVLSE